MPSHHVITPAVTEIALPAALDLSAALQLLTALRQTRGAAGAVALDASAVETLSVAGVQVIVAALKPPRPVAIIDPSGRLAQALRDLGFALPASVAQPAAGAREEAAPPPQCDNDIGWMEAVAAPPAASTRVLTIDDSKTMRDMLRLTLAAGGFEVLQAVDGEDGLDVLGRERVDVVITDINMPKMDGYEVIRSLRGRPEFAATPILVLTTESDAAKKQRARELGATGFIVKPFHPDSLVDVVRKVSP